MLIKICGIKDKETAQIVQNAGADFIGFVFAPSKRRIAPVKAAEIAKSLSPNLKKVGVFVNEPVKNIIHIAKLVGLDYVQLHGDEPAHVAKSIPYPVIKAFSIEQINPKTIHHYPCDYLLIDSPGKKYRGGSGKIFEWGKLNDLKIDRGKLILAGGLSPENVTSARESVQPAGVDVSSGVETEGIKDPFKIEKFMTQAKYEPIQKG